MLVLPDTDAKNKKNFFDFKKLLQILKRQSGLCLLRKNI